MDNLRMESHGFSIGRWCFPPFSLRGGESVTLCFPQQSVADRNRIITCLVGSERVSGLSLHSKSIFAQPATYPSGWRQWFSKSTPFDWMKKHTALSDDAIASFLHEHRMDRRIPLSGYAGTPRMVLGLVAAYARRPGVIIFSTSGLDPLGVRETFQIVAEHLPECSAVYLAWPFFSQGQQHHAIFPGSLSVSVIDKEGLPTTGISGVPTARSESDIAKSPN